MDKLSGFGKAHLIVGVGGVVLLPLLFFLVGKVACVVGATYWLSLWAVLGIFHAVYAFIIKKGKQDKYNY